jgi:hypothetical protein
MPHAEAAREPSRRLVQQAFRQMRVWLTRDGDYSPNIALEGTGNTHVIARLLAGHIARVVVSKPAEDTGDR